MDDQVIVYRPDTMEILGRSRSNQYKIVNPVELFSNHAKRLVEQKNLPQSNITVDDYVFEGGRKQKRTVTFHDLSDGAAEDDGARTAYWTPVTGTIV